MKTNVVFYTLVIAAITMLVASFLVPPTGVIDPSVLNGVGWVFAFAALTTVHRALDKGVDTKLTHKDTAIIFQHDNDDNDESEESQDEK